MDGEKPAIVLDKSYLDAASHRKLDELCQCFRVFATEVLVFELHTSESSRRGGSIKKLKAMAGKLRAAPSWNYLIAHERQSSKPCGDLENHDISPSLRRALSSDLAVANKVGIEDWESAREVFFERFVRHVREAPETFPYFKTGAFRGCLGAEEKTEIWRALACLPDVIREFYSEDIGEDSEWPEPRSIDEGWAIFRGYQVFLAQVAESYGRYGHNLSLLDEEPIRERLRNEYLDRDYITLALLAGALASNDEGMIQKFRALLPDGEVRRTS